MHCSPAHRLSTIAIGLLLIFLVSAQAAQKPWRAASPSDIEGVWRQVGSVVLNPTIDKHHSWFTAKQFFRFLPDGGVKHLLVDPDNQPHLTGLTPMQTIIMNQSKPVQKLTWRAKGIAMLKHPERPPVRIDIGLYTENASSGPKGGKIKPEKGDLIIVFYEYKDINKASYYRLLRKLQ